jgi:hypothetical protein
MIETSTEITTSSATQKEESHHSTFRVPRHDSEITAGALVAEPAAYPTPARHLAVRAA